MAASASPFHAHIYFDVQSRPVAAALRDRFRDLIAPGSDPQIVFSGKLVDGPIGPHPIPQFEVHFFAEAREAVTALIAATGLRALIHPLTHDDLADHTSLGHWIGEPVELDLSVLDPPGVNQGVARFGKSDF